MSLGELLGHVQDESVSEDFESQSLAVRLIGKVNDALRGDALEPRLCLCDTSSRPGEYTDKLASFGHLRGTKHRCGNELGTLGDDIFGNGFGCLWVDS
ncbi:hypothetical protein HG531_009736 [Fusarium graminearum]|nr:hypothetical protein HG531_009736 [Fusarium graminearum]